jgi:uncharacterized 2Fe-2S/4Fe-4S cluster protein (DUF4445 family)
MSEKFTIEFQPSGLKAASAGELSLLELGRSLGLSMESSCGGRGVCRSCAVRVEGQLAPPTAGERDAFSAEEIAAGWRRSCQTRPAGPCTVHIPVKTLGLHFSVGKDAAEELVSISEPLWTLDESARLWRRNGRSLHASAASAPLALAVDLGTTNIAASLVDLALGRVINSAAKTNPQVAFGADVISRLDYALKGEEQASQLQQAAVDAIAELATALAEDRTSQIVEVAVVGNTVMQHLFLGLPIAALARAPYSPAVLEAVERSAAELGFNFAPSARLYVAPNVAGFVGGDHLAALLDVHAKNPQGRWAMLDIGTNTEIALFADGKIASVSCASGPAFEGGKLQCGMRAAPGAIDRVKLNGAVELSTINAAPPIGLCGSGVLSLLAELRREGVIDTRGRMQLGRSFIRERAATRECVLFEERKEGYLPVVFTQADVRAVQLAKAAIRTGLEILLEDAGLVAEDLDRVMIAGAFGSFVDIDDAFTIGLIPTIARERVEQVGNSAGVGARQLAACAAARRKVQVLARGVRYLELATAPAFQKIFIANSLL